MQQSKYESGFGVVSLQRLIERDIVKKADGKRTDRHSRITSVWYCGRKAVRHEPANNTVLIEPKQKRVRLDLIDKNRQFAGFLSLWGKRIQAAFLRSVVRSTITVRRGNDREFGYKCDRRETHRPR